MEWLYFMASTSSLTNILLRAPVGKRGKRQDQMNTQSQRTELKKKEKKRIVIYLFYPRPFDSMNFFFN